MRYTITSDNAGSAPAQFHTLAGVKEALLDIFTVDAELEGETMSPALKSQIDALTDSESGVELHGFGITEKFTVDPRQHYSDNSEG